MGISPKLDAQNTYLCQLLRASGLLGQPLAGRNGLS